MISAPSQQQPSARHSGEVNWGMPHTNDSLREDASYLYQIIVTGKETIKPSETVQSLLKTFNLSVDIYASNIPEWLERKEELIYTSALRYFAMKLAEYATTSKKYINEYKLIEVYALIHATHILLTAPDFEARKEQWYLPLVKHALNNHANTCTLEEVPQHGRFESLLQAIVNQSEIPRGYPPITIQQPGIQKACRMKASRVALFTAAVILLVGVAATLIATACTTGMGGFIALGAAAGIFQSYPGIFALGTVTGALTGGFVGYFYQRNKILKESRQLAPTVENAGSETASNISTL